MTEDDRIKLEPSWKHALRDQFEQPYMAQLREFLRQEHAAGKEIYPPGPLIFNALNSTPLDKVKVVILGQDPYHGPGQAHGRASRCNRVCRRRRHWSISIKSSSAT